ncbi:hypothetical protein [Neptunitalea lumnitzerae]|uniref:LAGLIDADG homing endonuclease n=1 Tax=Neptunitalea lumnitzerae TaxID=2965509 RepID=A0ABQ5MFR8_9FLAO|nr:hypothetical protein [Neptunitalea sp. Y10]GLB48202.1 hypothetical protein Y10_05700 [Neptunitalea sp. Y10]
MKLEDLKINEILGITSDTTFSIIENFYIKKYGSREEAEKVFEDLVNSHDNDDDLQAAVTEKLKKDFYYNYWKVIIEIFSESTGCKDLLKRMSDFKASESSLSFKKIAPKMLHDYENYMKPAFEEILDISEDSKNEIISYIHKINTFSLSQTRKELGYPDPRTFNYWLIFLFGNKYKAKTKEKGRNAGKISLLDYIKIVSAFILRHDESKIDFSKPEKMLERFESQKSTHKKILIELEGYYAKLREKLEDVNLSNTYTDKFKNKKFDINKRKFPYVIYSIIEDALKNVTHK